MRCADHCRAPGPYGPLCGPFQSGVPASRKPSNNSRNFSDPAGVDHGIGVELEGITVPGPRRRRIPARGELVAPHEIEHPGAQLSRDLSRAPGILGTGNSGTPYRTLSPELGTVSPELVSPELSERVPA